MNLFTVSRRFKNLYSDSYRETLILKRPLFFLICVKTKQIDVSPFSTFNLTVFHTVESDSKQNMPKLFSSAFSENEGNENIIYDNIQW